MPHATVRLVPGVDTYKTQALNEAAVFSCNLIRYTPDPSGAGLVQKLGGWSRFYPNAMPSTPRHMWAWADLNRNNWLAIGCDIIPGGGGVSTLAAITNGHFFDVTPHVKQDNVAVNVSTVINSNVVTITDATSTITTLDSVSIPVHISIGGVVIYGFYPATAVGGTTYTISLFDSQGNPILATSTVTNAGSVESFATTNGSASVQVTLNGNSYIPGDTYPVNVATPVGGITLSGEYVVQTIIDANNFTILAANAATATTSATINGGNARYNYWLTFAPSIPGTGYGAGAGYGVGGYGSGVIPTGTIGTSVATQDWTLDNWGEILIAVPCLTTFGSPDNATVIGGPVCYWSPSGGLSNATAIAQGPAVCAGAFVAMPQRQIIAYGCEELGIQDPLLVRWCDVDNFFVWNGTPINFAGKFRLTRGSKIVGGMQVAQQGLLWTDVGLWSMQFVGVSGSPGSASDVYSFSELARGCGLIAQKAAGILGGVTYWMGQSQFFTLSGNGVQPIVCPVWDKIFQNLDKNNLRKIRCCTNSNFGEVSWEYASKNGNGEIDSYVKFNTLIGAPQGWDYGSLSRTAWTDQSVLGPPIGGDGTNNVIYQHEVSNDADGQPLHAIFQTGFFVMNDADIVYFVDQFVPDMKWGLDDGTSFNAQLLLTFFVKGNFPDDPTRTYGPFTLSQAVKFVTPRFRGCLVAFQVESVDTGTFWRMGANRYRYASDGKFY